VCVRVRCVLANGRELSGLVPSFLTMAVFRAFGASVARGLVCEGVFVCGRALYAHCQAGVFARALCVSVRA
jgi:hypothetical protein